jgi:hypothetical protein
MFRRKSTAMSRVPPKEEPAFTVALDSKATWCISYADKEGRMRFCFEPGEEKQRVFLNPRPSVDEKMPTGDFYQTSRYKLALERTKQYLISCAYEVLLDD